MVKLTLHRSKSTNEVHFTKIVEVSILINISKNPLPVIYDKVYKKIINMIKHNNGTIISYVDYKICKSVSSY